jgi:hypothetical protein
VIWTWDPSCSPDVAFYLLFVALVQLTGWTPCPTLELPDQVCPVYDRGAWVLVAETPGLSMVDSSPAPPAGSAWLIDVRAIDRADQVSAAEGGACE